MDKSAFSVSFNGFGNERIDNYKIDDEVSDDGPTLVYTKTVFKDGSEKLDCHVNKDFTTLSALNLMAKDLELKKDKKVQKGLRKRSML